MKKLPIIMSALSLVAGTAGLFTARNVLADTTQGDLLHLESNVYAGRMLPEQINLNENFIAFSPGVSDGAYDATRIIFAIQNYEAGFSEEAADTALANLGKIENDALLVLDDTYYGTEQAFQRRFYPEVVTLADNKSDRLYYAIQFGRRVTDGGTVSWEDVWWERGKIGYRDCVHSSVFDPKTTLCNRIYDEGGMQKYHFAVANSTNGEVINPPAGEQVITWPEEWKQIQQERLNEVQSKLTNLQLTLNNLDHTLSDAENTLDQLALTLPGTADSENMQAQLAELQRLLSQIRELLKKYQVVDPDQAQEVTKLQAELEQLKKKYAELESRNQVMQEQYTDLQAEYAALNDSYQKSQDGAKKLEDEVAQLRQAQTEAEKDRELLVQENTRLATALATAEAAAKKADCAIDNQVTNQTKNQVQDDTSLKERTTQEPSVTDANTAAASKSSTSDTSVPTTEIESVDSPEVPVLGEARKPFNLWWAIAPGILAIILLGYVLKKSNRK